MERVSILCGMWNFDHVWFADYQMRKKVAEFSTLCSVNKVVVCYLLNKHVATFTIVSYCQQYLSCSIRTSRYSDGDTFTTLSSRVDSYKYSFFPRTSSDWNKLPLSVRSKPTVDSFRVALLQLPGPVEKHCWAITLRQ